MADPDIQKAGGGGGGGHPDSVIGGGGLKKKFPPFRLQFGLKIRGGSGPPGPFPGSVTGFRDLWVRGRGRD